MSAASAAAIRARKERVFEQIAGTMATRILLYPAAELVGEYLALKLQTADID